MAVLQKVLDDRRVSRVQAILTGADEAGGPLFAPGLAFHALFAMLPGLLLLAGLAGWLVDDPKVRATLVLELVRTFPPLAAPVSETLQRLVAERGAFSVLGLLGLVWGASNFYGALDEAMARLIPGERRRGLVERRVRGLVAVAVLLGASVLSVVAGSAWSFVEGTLAVGDDLAVWRFVPPAATILLMTIAAYFVYRTVPTAPPGWRAALPPALLAGVGIAVLTNVFTLLAPRLIGALQAFGVLAALFGALLWLNYVFQVLIIGAAWARLRRDDESGRVDAGGST